MLVLVSTTALFIAPTFSQNRSTGSSVIEAKPAPCDQNKLMCSTSNFCFDTGPFSVTILQISDSAAGNYRRIRLNVRFQNLTARAITLAYHAKTSVLSDEAGSTYFCCKAGESGPDTSATGIGTNQDGKTDTWFVLDPAASDFATFDLWGFRKGKDAPTSFHYDLAIDQLDPNNPKLVIRQRALFFRDFNAKTKFP
jgi:hypothetical protein